MHILRWILVLPAAMIAQFAVRMLGGAILGVAAGLLGPGIRDSPPLDWLYLIVSYFVSALAFVVAGAMLAPRGRTATAVTLMLLGIALSLTKHVVGPQLAGNRVGATNWLHAGLEAAGMVVGAILIGVAARNRDGLRRG